MNKAQKVLKRATIKTLEETAFMAELTYPFSSLRKRGLKSMYGKANKLRTELGEEPKPYYTIEKRKKVRLI